MTRVIGHEAKIDRARRLVDDVSARARDYFAEDPFTLEEHEDSGTDGWLILRARVRSQPPVELPALAGDAVHNARSALDHLAWRLVEANGSIPDEYTCFPIADQPTGYRKKLKRALRGAAPEVWDAVRAMSPWRDGDDLLWKLHRLDVVDKHRLLLIVAAIRTAQVWTWLTRKASQTPNPPGQGHRRR